MTRNWRGAKSVPEGNREQFSGRQVGFRGLSTIKNLAQHLVADPKPMRRLTQRQTLANNETHR